MLPPPIDFETYSEAGYVWDEQARKWRGPPGAPGTQRGLGVVGAAAYARHPSTEVLCLSYADGQHWRPGMPNPQPLLDYVAAGGLLEAWNSGFEWWVWNEVCVPRYGWPPLRLEQLRCAMAKSRAHALPGKLELAGDVLQLRTRKDKDGTRLLDKFSKPRNPTKADQRLRIRPEDEPVDGPRLYSYNHTDCASEYEASTRTPDLAPLELQHWLNDQRINRRGVAVDVEGVEACCAIVEAAIARYDAELVALTGCKSTELQQLIGWLHGQGVHTDSLDAESVEALLATALPDAARRALTIRATVGSASVKKVFAMRLQATRGRLHDLYNYHGARTGRPTGEGPQPTNLPKAGPDVHRCGWLGRVPLPGGGCGRYFGGRRLVCPWCGTVRGPAASKPVEWNPGAAEDALEVIAWRSLDALEWYFGDAMLTIAGCLRGLFVAAPGHTLVSSDFTAIEGVVIACLAGEQWRIDAYAADAPIYLLSAERMYGVTVAEMQAYAKEHGKHHPRRQDGKFGELGLGFGGWVGALRGLGANGTDDELKAKVLKWRAASAAVVWFWGGQTKGSADCVRADAGMLHPHYPLDRWDRTRELFGLEGMAVAALESPGATFRVHRLDGTDSGIAYCYGADEDVLRCYVPSGGHITYHRPRLAPAEQEWRGLSITYEGYNTNPKQGPMGWVTMSLYSGKAAENVTQKVARDIQMHAINNCEQRGYPVVLHTYDEIVAEVVTGEVEQLEAHMVDVPEWARGWPIKAAGGWMARRYRKG
jgi:DNA polymerase